MSSVVISPSILSADPLSLGAEIAKVEMAGADWHHVDVMDGHFVPNLTFGIPLVKALKRVAKKPLDVHIMISNPEEFLAEYIAAGANILTFHVEATFHSHRLLQRIRDLGAKAGIALNPGTPVEWIYPVLSEIDIVMIMSVNPGFGGQSFIQSSIEKIKKLKSELQSRRMEHRVLIQVDGGINAQTGREVVAAGAQILVAGSFIYGAQDYQRAINQLKTIS